MSHRTLDLLQSAGIPYSAVARGLLPCGAGHPIARHGLGEAEFVEALRAGSALAARSIGSFGTRVRLQIPATETKS